MFSHPWMTDGPISPWANLQTQQEPSWTTTTQRVCLSWLTPTWPPMETWPAAACWIKPSSSEEFQCDISLVRIAVTLSTRFLFIRFEFATKQGYWYISQTTLSYDVKINNNPFTVNDLVLTTADISTPLGFSWHCSPKSQLATYGYSFNGTIITYTNKVIFETNGFQLQPFTIINDKFGHG